MDDWIPINDALLATGALCLLVTGLLVQRAWRGRLVTWSPCCRRCGFDLRGHAGHSCPECGADLGRAGAVTEGLRRHRPGLLAVAFGVLVLATTMVLAARFAVPERAWTWWLANRPVWAMEGVLRDQDQIAWQSIEARDRAGVLSDADLRLVLAIAMDLPASSGQFITPSWAWLINQHSLGRVSLQALKPVVLRAIETMDVGLGIVPVGQRAGALVQIAARNGGRIGPFDDADIDLISVEAELDGSWVQVPIERQAPPVRHDRLPMSGTAMVIRAPDRLGPCALRAKVRVSAREPSANLFRQGEILASCERVVSLGTLRVLDPTATFALGAHDETFRARVHAMLIQRIGGYTPQPGSSGRSRASGANGLAANEGFDFDIEGVQGDRVLQLGQVSCIGGQESTALQGRAGIDPTAPWILRLVPRLDRVETGLTEPTRIYDGIIEIPRGPIDAPARDRHESGAGQP